MTTGPEQLRIAACDAGSQHHIHWQEYMADAADKIEQLQFVLAVATQDWTENDAWDAVGGQAYDALWEIIEQAREANSEKSRYRRLQSAISGH